MAGAPVRASRLGAQTWLLAIFQIVSNPKGRSSVQLAADLGVCQKSAWRLAHRIRSALAEGSLPGFEGPVEADETYIGGKARDMHARKRSLRASGPADKAPVVAVRDRAGGQAAATPVHEVTAAAAAAMVQATANAAAAVFTDGHKVHDPLTEMGFHHAAVTHSVGEHARGEVSTNGVENYRVSEPEGALAGRQGEVSTNGVENYRSCLKRTYIGAHHYMSDDHLHRHIEKHSFRYNRRDRHLSDRPADAARAMNGRRPPRQQLTPPARAARPHPIAAPSATAAGCRPTPQERHNTPGHPDDPPPWLPGEEPPVDLDTLQAATRALDATTQHAPPRANKPRSRCPPTSTPNSHPRTPPR